MTDLQIKYIIHRYKNLLMEFDLHANGTLSFGDVMFEADVEHRKKETEQWVVERKSELSGTISRALTYWETLKDLIKLKTTHQLETI